MHTKTRWLRTSRKISRNNSVRWNRVSKSISSCPQNLTGHASDCRIVLGRGWISLYYLRNLRNLIKTLTPRRINPTDRDGMGGTTHCLAFRFCILETKHCVWLNLAFYARFTLWSRYRHIGSIPMWRYCFQWGTGDALIKVSSVETRRWQMLALSKPGVDEIIQYKRTL